MYMFTRCKGSTDLQQKMVKVELHSPSGSNEHAQGENTGAAPLVVSYNNRIRPLLDAVDRLRQLKVMQEGIQLPTIVVVGDQSSGKSSVLESLAGISLPRGQGICTRVPLVMRLENHSDLEPDMQLEYLDKIVKTSEDLVTQSINMATEEIAGNAKGISHTPLTLVVKKEGVPDLTMVDLPGITRVPVHGQPDDIYEQISKIIREYITPSESIILNVLSATVDFTTCESIRMSQRVDKTGERTLAVVTKADKAPEGLLDKVTNDDVNIGLGYVCVRNRIGDESYKEARFEEARLFKSHPLLSNIDQSMVGIPVLAQKLVEIQAASIGKCLPDIVNNINIKLSECLSELEKLPKKLESVGEAMTAFMRILSSAKDSLRKLLLRGEFDEFSDDAEMHCTARLKEKLDDFAENLKKNSSHDSYPSNQLFLLDEISVLEEAKGICLPNFLPRSAFLTILQKKVKSIADTPVEFVTKVWTYIEEIIVKVLYLKCSPYPQLHKPVERAAQNLMMKVRERSIDRVKEIVEMETLSDYTSNPEYMNVWTRLMENQKEMMEEIGDVRYHGSKVQLEVFGEVDVGHFRNYPSLVTEDVPYHGSKVQLEGFSEVDVGHLRNYPSLVTEDVPYHGSKVQLEGFGEVDVGHLRNYPSLVTEAFDMKMRVTAYWKIVVMRMVDCMALHILFSVQKLINQVLEGDIVSELGGPHLGGLERMLQESPSIATKRERLNKSVKMLRDAKDTVANILDGISADHDSA